MRAGHKRAVNEYRSVSFFCERAPISCGTGSLCLVFNVFQTFIRADKSGDIAAVINDPLHFYDLISSIMVSKWNYFATYDFIDVNRKYS